MTLLSDYQKIAKNKFIQATLFCSFWNSQGVQKRAELTGYMMGGFGRGMSNDFGDLLKETRLQDSLSNAMQIGIGLSNMYANSTIDSMRFGSMLQSVQLWKKSNAPSFSVKLLFFDSTGSGWILDVARILELTQLPYYADLSTSSPYNLFMKAPQCYSPLRRDTLNEKNPNKKFSLTAEGLSTFHVGAYMSISDLIITGVQNDFSELMLNTGTPIYLQSTITLKYWRTPDQDMIMNSYNVSNKYGGY